MARKDRPRSQRLVFHTASSRADLISIYVYTDSSFGDAQADRYLIFLESETDRLAQDPHIGSEIQGFPGVRLYVAKLRNSRSAYGHRIFYREVEGGIEVIRMLHTAMDWPTHLVVED